MSEYGQLFCSVKISEIGVPICFVKIILVPLLNPFIQQLKISDNLILFNVAS